MLEIFFSKFFVKALKLLLLSTAVWSAHHTMEPTETKGGGDAGLTNETGSSKEPQAQEQAVTQHVPQQQQQKEPTRAAEAPSRSKFIEAGDLVIVWMVSCNSFS